MKTRSQKVLVAVWAIFGVLLVTSALGVYLITTLSSSDGFALRVSELLLPQAPIALPNPHSLPPEVPQSLSEELARLERLLATHAPHALASLRPGLTPDEIKALEKSSGLALTDDLRTLYAWHDGIDETSQQTLFFMYDFPPLESLIAARDAMAKQAKSENLIERVAMAQVARTTGRWIGIFPDGAGDGYYVDPTGHGGKGTVFCNMMEDSEFVIYPSLKNLIAAISDTYEAGLYDVDPVGSATQSSTAPSTQPVQQPAPRRFRTLPPGYSGPAVPAPTSQAWADGPPPTVEQIKAVRKIHAKYAWQSHDDEVQQ